MLKTSVTRGLRRFSPTISSFRCYHDVSATGDGIGHSPFPSCNWHFHVNFSKSKNYDCRYFSTAIDNRNDDSEHDNDLESSSSSKLPADDRNSQKVKPINIYYGSQTGTAQLFSMQLADAISEAEPDRSVSFRGLHETSSPDQLFDPQNIHFILTSTAGVGEPPENAQAFFDWIMTNEAAANASTLDWTKIDYAVFGLGNSIAHANHYCAAAKSLDKKLQELGANRIQEIGLGDDSDCIDDDFDQWTEDTLISLKKYEDGDDDDANQEVEDDDGDDNKEEATTFMSVVENKEENSSYVDDEKDNDFVDCSGAKCLSGKRYVVKKYPRLILQTPQTDIMREDLFFLKDSERPFYHPDTLKLRVVANKKVSSCATETGLKEMKISLLDYPDLQYEAGDHICLYPRNAMYLVEGYLNILDVNPDANIKENSDAGVDYAEGSGSNSNCRKQYPLPNGLTVKEVLRHCLDLNAIPSPAFARTISGRGKDDLNYKQEVAVPHVTTLEMMRAYNYTPSLEELIWNLPLLQPRFYSIASSPRTSPKLVRLTYRPVKYVTSTGHLHEGVATSYMSSLGVKSEFVAARIRSNPTFRLPPDLSVPIVMIAGGCGVAPIRAFIEERMAYEDTTNNSSSNTDVITTNYGPAYLFLGFRNPKDAAYRNFVTDGLACGALTSACLTYDRYSCSSSPPAATSGHLLDESRGRISDAIYKNGKLIYDAIQQGGYVYICGGARGFGIAIENELLKIYQEEGKMSFDEATMYQRKLIETGHFCEDLA